MFHFTPKITLFTSSASASFQPWALPWKSAPKYLQMFPTRPHFSCALQYLRRPLFPFSYLTIFQYHTNAFINIRKNAPTISRQHKCLRCATLYWPLPYARLVPSRHAWRIFVGIKMFINVCRTAKWAIAILHFSTHKEYTFNISFSHYYVGRQCWVRGFYFDMLELIGNLELNNRVHDVSDIMGRHRSTRLFLKTTP